MAPIEHPVDPSGPAVGVVRVSAAPEVDVEVRVVDGSEPGFLLVHGLASNARLWDGVVAALAARGHAVAALDQRGHGRSSKPPGGYDFATITDDLVAVIRHLGWDRPVVAGQSWGGNVVLELAWRHPDAVRAVACVDGGTIELADRFPTWDACEAALAPPHLEGMPATRLEGAIRAAHPSWPESGITGTMANFEVRPDGTVRPWLDRAHHLLILRALWEHRPSTRFPSVDVPVLLLPADTGDVAWTHDKAASVDAALAALPNGRAQWFSPADHDVHTQHPQAVADALEGLLA